ncbi:hypothetical protein PLICRDRAFT_568956 [Plicaturopsis crispa FD-325 SS-3]|nr:hypothetical protein PLICRDRAFT_568956 [Plicaturopsis crispa FD-325 SS-3]
MAESSGDSTPVPSIRSSSPDRQSPRLSYKSTAILTDDDDHDDDDELPDFPGVNRPARPQALAEDHASAVLAKVDAAICRAMGVTPQKHREIESQRRLEKFVSAHSRHRSESVGEGSSAINPYHDSDEEEHLYASSSKTPSAVSLLRRRNPCVHGHIRGVEIGTEWKTRCVPPLRRCLSYAHHALLSRDVSAASVHAPFTAGIYGRKDDGAYSIVMSGGYTDLDKGDSFTYTGAGGYNFSKEDWHPSVRISDQSMDHKHNQLLVESFDNGKPVRVVRGTNANSIYAPEEGFRYDGLYTVVKYWEDVGPHGFVDCKFQFRAVPGQSKRFNFGWAAPRMLEGVIDLTEDDGAMATPPPRRRRRLIKGRRTPDPSSADDDDDVIVITSDSEDEDEDESVRSAKRARYSDAPSVEV